MKPFSLFYFQGDADIPEDPQVAFKANALKVTRIDAVAQVRFNFRRRRRQKSLYFQVKSMVALVDDIAATALQSMVKKLAPFVFILT